MKKNDIAKIERKLKHKERSSNWKVADVKNRFLKRFVVKGFFIKNKIIGADGIIINNEACLKYGLITENEYLANIAKNSSKNKNANAGLVSEFDEDIEDQSEKIIVVGKKEPKNYELDKDLNVTVNLDEKYKNDPKKLSAIKKYIIDKNAFDGLTPSVREVESKCSPQELQQSRFMLMQQLSKNSPYDLSFLEPLNKVLIADITHSRYELCREEIQSYIIQLERIKIGLYENAVRDDIDEPDETYSFKIMAMYQYNREYEILKALIDRFMESNQDILYFYPMYTGRVNQSAYSNADKLVNMAAAVYNKKDFMDACKLFGLEQNTNFTDYESKCLNIFEGIQNNAVDKVEKLKLAHANQQTVKDHMNIDHMGLFFNDDLFKGSS